MEFDAIVAGVHLRHDGVRQRPHHILARLAARVPTLYVEEPFAAAADRDEWLRDGPLHVLRPHRRETSEPTIDSATLQAVRAWVERRRPLLWLTTPMLDGVTAGFAGAPLVYDCMDDLASFAFAPPAMRERERALLERADIIFAGGRTLFERRSKFAAKLHLFPSGVEFEHFAGAQVMAPAPQLAKLARPIFGYTGVIDERIDYEVLRAFARRELTLALLGPTAKVEPADLPRAPSLHYFGQIDYGQLPAYVAGFDVALLPFAQNAATANISPTKTPEYLAAGKPVVSSPIADVVRDYGDVVSFAATPETFVDAALSALQPNPWRRSRGIERARARTWDATVAGMLEAINRLGAFG